MELTQEDMIQYLHTLHVPEEKIAQFTGMAAQGNYQQLYRSLRCLRCDYLDAVHESQKQLDQLDYLIYLIKSKQPASGGDG